MKKSVKKSVKKYNNGGETSTRKNILGQTIKETYSESGAPSFDENRRLTSSKYTKEVYRKDGSLAKRKEQSTANKLFGQDVVTKKIRFNKQGDVKSVRGGSGKDIGYKKGGSVKSKKK